MFKLLPLAIGLERGLLRLGVDRSDGEDDGDDRDDDDRDDDDRDDDDELELLLRLWLPRLHLGFSNSRW